MNKFDRITAILIYFQSKRLITAQELSGRFKVSQRTIYRDIETLNNAGVPIVGELGVGYSMMEGYRLPPVMFTQEEAIAFLLAEKVFQKYGDAQYKKHFETALFKVKSVLRSSEKDMTEEMEGKIRVIKNAGQNVTIDKNLPFVIRSLTDKEALRIKYSMLSVDNRPTYTIEPIGIINENGNWLTIAYCTENKSYRKFRIDRIININFSGQRFSKDHITLNEFLSDQKSNEVVFQPVIKVKKEVAHYLEAQKYLYGFVGEKEDGHSIEMTFETTCLQTFLRWFLTIADNAQVVEPKELKSLLTETVKAVQKNL